MRNKPEYTTLLANNSITNSALKTFLRETFTAQIHRNYPVVKFVKTVFDFSPSDLPKRRRFSLPINPCNDYAILDGERNCYDPLKRIFNNLLRQVCKTDAARPLLAHFVDMYDRQPDSSTGVKLKPDFCISTQSDRNSQHWLSCLGYGEVKRRSKKIEFHGDCLVDLSAFDLVCQHIIIFRMTVYTVDYMHHTGAHRVLASISSL